MTGEHWEKIWENSMEAILLFDEEGKIVSANATAKKELGYADTILGQSMATVFPKLFTIQSGKIAIIDENSKNKLLDNRVVEDTAYRANQTCFAVDVKVLLEPKMDENSFFGMCCFINTATKVGAIKDMVKAKEKVENATKVRNEFVSNVTHELRTPVNGILGISKNLMDTPLDEQQKESIQIIHMCCSNMIQIINNLLDFSKLEAGKFTLEEREFSFRQALEKIIAMNINQVNEKGLKLILNISPEIPEHVIGDELRITQILTNLLNNAVKFTSVGQIMVDVVKTYELNNMVELFFIVMDTGIGIAPEDMDKLFKSFSQVDASITRKFGGSGLGLTIVKELVELMDGEIHVESEKGKGSTFSFSIRLKKADQEVVESRAYASGKFVYERSTRREIKDIDEEIYNIEEIYRLGSADNIRELHAAMEKLIICLEMENWDKAEIFSETVKKLVETDKDLKRKAFRVEMTVRKADGEAAIAQYKELEKALEETVFHEK